MGEQDNKTKDKEQRKEMIPAGLFIAVGFVIMLAGGAPTWMYGAILVFVGFKMAENVVRSNIDLAQIDMWYTGQQAVLSAIAAIALQRKRDGKPK